MSTPSTHVTAKCVWDGARLHHDDVVLFNAKVRKRLQPGAGETFIIRVEREAEAKKHHQLKWYWGYIVRQCIKHTYETATERDDDFRARFMPPDVPTLSLMSYEQMDVFNMHCEVFAAEVIGVSIIGPDDARHWHDPA